MLAMLRTIADNRESILTNRRFDGEHDYRSYYTTRDEEIAGLRRFYTTVGRYVGDYSVFNLTMLTTWANFGVFGLQRK